MEALLAARLATHEQLLLCRNGARMTTGGLESEPGAALVPNDPVAVAALQRALVDQGFSLGAGGPEGDGVDGDYGQMTAQAVLGFKQREGLAQPGEASYDGVTSTGTTTRLDQLYRHELVDALIASLAGGPWDPGARTGDLVPAEVEGLFEASTAAGGRLLDAITAATYAPPTLDAAWQAEGGAGGEFGRPVGLPFALESGRAAMDFEGGRMIDDPAGYVVVPRWALEAGTEPFDLGEPTAGAASDPLAPAGSRVPFERGIAFSDPEGEAFAFPDELLQEWSEAVSAGTGVGMPNGLPALDLAAGAISFPFEQTTLSIPSAAVTVTVGELIEVGEPPVAGAPDHRRFIVPLSSPSPRPEQIRPPTFGNSAEHFINGDVVLPEMVADIRRAAKAGDQGFVYIAGWWLRHDFQISLGGTTTTTLGDELRAAIEAGAEVRGMIWDGLALYRYQVAVAFNRASADALNAAGADILVDGQVQLAGSHHQKLTICFDGSTISSWVGGIDWNEDRLRSVFADAPRGKEKVHPGYPSFDNMVRVRGAGAHELLRGWLERWEKRTGKTGLRGRGVSGPFPALDSVITQVSHTYGPGCPFPTGVTTAAATIEHVIRNARDYVYIEDQYLFMSRRMEAALISCLKRGVTVIAVIAPDEVCEAPFGRQARFDAITRVAEASGLTGAGGLNVFESLATGGSPVGPRAYTHCKVVIADDQAAVIGSVNSSNRSWTHDSEVATLFVDAIGAGGTAPGTRGFPRQARCDLWRGHGAVGAIAGDHAADVPAFLSTATAGGFLRGYNMVTRPTMEPLDYTLGSAFWVAIDPV